MIRDALQAAELSAAEVDAVEAHGTGTPLGDPIEAQALLATYGAEHTAETPLWLGSIKSNVGHTQAAAGGAGVIKMVLAMQHGQLPKTLHAEQPSPHIDWSSGALALIDTLRPWQANGHPRRAGVSSFGVSGTNAHVILEEAPPTGATGDAPASPRPSRPVPLMLSAKTRGALRGQARALHQHLQAHPALDLADVGNSLTATRNLFGQRAILVARDRDDALEQLRGVADGKPDDRVIAGEANVRGKTVFVFPGHGAHWPGMAAQLLEDSEVFASEVAACERALQPYIEWSLLDVLRDAPDAPSLERLDVMQPVLFTVMVSLAGCWRALGVEPDAVIGHSQGEIAAAYVAGALSLPDAARVIGLRSRSLLKLIGHSAMMATKLPAAELQPWLAPFNGEVTLAADNGPGASVVSGPIEALETVQAQLTDAKLFARIIRRDCATHCPAVELVRE